MKTLLSSSSEVDVVMQTCPGLNAVLNTLYDRHHKVSSLTNVHQNTHNSVKYEVRLKCQITQSNMKYCLTILVFNPGHKYSCGGMAFSSVNKCYVLNYTIMYCAQKKTGVKVKVFQKLLN